MATNKKIADRLRQWLQNANRSDLFVQDILAAADALDDTAAEQVRAIGTDALDRVCGVHLNDGRALETVFSADECQRIVDAAFDFEQVRASELTQSTISIADAIAKADRL